MASLERTPALASGLRAAAAAVVMAELALQLDPTAAAVALLEQAQRAVLTAQVCPVA